MSNVLIAIAIGISLGSKEDLIEGNWSNADDIRECVYVSLCVSLILTKGENAFAFAICATAAIMLASGSEQENEKPDNPTISRSISQEFYVYL